jgi:hypothetical protein
VTNNTGDTLESIATIDLVQQEPNMTEKISVAGWTTTPNDSEMVNLEGSVLSVMVGGMIGPGPTPLGERFRFARVIRVEPRPEQPATCARCDSLARWQIHVEWEVGYVSHDGDILCEGCVSGLVTAGAQLIAFGESTPRRNEGSQSVVVTFDLAKGRLTDRSRIKQGALRRIHWACRQCS